MQLTSLEFLNFPEILLCSWDWVKAGSEAHNRHALGEHLEEKGRKESREMGKDREGNEKTVHFLCFNVFLGKAREIGFLCPPEVTWFLVPPAILSN